MTIAAKPPFKKRGNSTKDDRKPGNARGTTRRPAEGSGKRMGQAAAESPAVVEGLAADVLNAAVAATAQLLTFSLAADAALSAFFRARKSGARDRAFIAETAYAVLRRKRLLERLAASGPNLEPEFLAPGLTPRHGPRHGTKPAGPRRISPRELVLLSLSRVRGMSQRQLEGALLPGEAEWLANIRRQPEPELTLAEQLDFPDWLVERLTPRMSPEDLLALARALNTPAPLDLRVNTLKAEPEAVIKRLAADGIVATPCPYSPVALRLKTKPFLQKHPACLSGENDTRVKRLSGKVDRVLVDAPCSGLGTLRRNPDLKWRQSAQSVDELTAKQAAILASAAKLLRPGGRLVYATCSILAEENEGIVDAFLASHADFHRLSAQEVLAGQGIVIDCGEDMRLSPQKHGTDGFYAAVLERVK